MTVELAREVAARIGALDGVVAVTLGGRLVDRVLAGRRTRTSPYPPALRREVVRRYLWGEAAGFPRTPPGFAAGVDATLSGLGPEPAALEAALQAMVALTATVRQTPTSVDCR